MEGSTCVVCFDMDTVSGDSDFLACGGHGICCYCLCHHVEVQILQEGSLQIRCPGFRCSHLLSGEDLHLALRKSRQREKALETLALLRNQCYADRLHGVLDLGMKPDEMWILRECQPCPRCLVMVRRETGCPHVHCSCGCDFCFDCGSPYQGERSGCLCHNRGGYDAVPGWHGMPSWGFWLERNASAHPTIEPFSGEVSLIRECSKAHALGLELSVFLRAPNEHRFQWEEDLMYQELYDSWRSWADEPEAAPEHCLDNEAMAESYVEPKKFDRSSRRGPGRNATASCQWRGREERARRGAAWKVDAEARMAMIAAKRLQRLRRLQRQAKMQLGSESL